VSAIISSIQEKKLADGTDAEELQQIPYQPFDLLDHDQVVSGNDPAGDEEEFILYSSGPHMKKLLGPAPARGFGVSRNFLSQEMLARCLSPDDAQALVNIQGLLRGEMRGEMRPSSTLPPRVLRNLTTKEYISDEAVAASEYAYSLGEVVLTTAQYSYNRGKHMKWAGHRFDIVCSN
jgi:hypothetical protein